MRKKREIENLMPMKEDRKERLKNPILAIKEKEMIV